MVWRDRLHRKWAITVAHSPLTGIWYSLNTCTMKGLIEVSPEKCTKKKNGITSMRGRSVGGRSRSRIRSSISTCFPQHVLPPTGASVSETIEFVNYFKPEVQISLWLTVSMSVLVSNPTGAPDRSFCVWGQALSWLYWSIAWRVNESARWWKSESSFLACAPRLITTLLFFWGGGGGGGRGIFFLAFAPLPPSANS